MRPLLVVPALALPLGVLAQELEPRAYSNAPIGTSFAIASYTRISGPVLLDPSLVAVNINARVNAYTLGYARFFSMFGRTASVSVAVPYIESDLHGEVVDAASDVHRAGFGDTHLRGAINLFGHPALTPAEFVQRPEVLSGGASLSMIVPTGQYEPTRFINVGTNRWAFKPDVGISYPIGRWFTEAAAGVWLFTDNDDVLGGKHRSQAPLWVYQLHAGYSFRPGLWLAADYGYYTGGNTTLDGVAKDDAQRNSRVGLALSLPIGHGWSGKLAWSKGTTVRVGGDYSMASITAQYRWFD